jgi:uncharacterized oligopeptide transporter (OPT) family protein
VDRSRPYRELTPAAVIGGVLLGAVLNMGICFAGLQIGFTIVGSAVAAVLGFGVLRGLLRVGTILEVNIFQTVASAVNTVNAGIIFTVPVLFLMGMQEQINYTALILATMSGALLGVSLIIPLRKQIIDYERLRFPEGTAVAAILRAPGAGQAKSRLLLGGILASALLTVLIKSAVVPEAVDLGSALGIPASIKFVLAVSALSLGAGFIAGRGGLVVLYGTLLNYWMLIPVAILLGWLPHDLPASMSGLFEGRLDGLNAADADTFFGRFAHFTSRHVGIGMMLGGALAGILLAAPALKAALTSLRGSGGKDDEREELPLILIAGCTVAGLLGVFVSIHLSGGGSVGWGQSFACTVAAGAWLWLAGLVVAQTTGRTDWSPLSGLALIAIAIMMAILGTEDAMMIPAVTIGAAVCVATSMCADMMADLKTGYLIGGRPIRQQLAQMSVAWIGPGIAILTVLLLWKAYGFGPAQTQILHQRAIAAGPEALAAFTEAGGSADVLPKGTPKLPAPQAGAIQGAMEVFRSGDVPLGKYLAGLVLGLLASLLVSPGIGVMVGLSMYLPFENMAVFGIGGLLAMWLGRRRGHAWCENVGLPVAAGLIVGNALVDVLYAVIKVSASV